MRWGRIWHGRSTPLRGVVTRGRSDVRPSGSAPVWGDGGGVRDGRVCGFDRAGGRGGGAIGGGIKTIFSAGHMKLQTMDTETAPKSMVGLEMFTQHKR